MNDVFINIQAAGSGRLARLVKHGVVTCVLSLTAAGALAGGQEQSPRRDDMQQQQQRERYESRAQDARSDVRAYEIQMQDEMRRRAMEEQGRAQRDEGRRVRMTPDERRELKRQINEAGMDLYPHARRR
jgi:hypothetical protein